MLTRAQLPAAQAHQEGKDSKWSVDIRVTRLRSKIDADPGRPSLILTVRVEGYMFVPPLDG